MKILRLDLRAFGPFTDIALDISAGKEGFHLIYGPNEAGKTSALRAMRNLLYGIPGNTQDHFLHDYRALRVGATLQRRDGQTLEIVRRKGLKGTLLPPDESAPIDESVLRSFLSGCDQSQFETMFGIDHAGLIAGGQAIVRGHGEIGHVLFAAGAGISDLRTIRGNLEGEADELFKPGGTKPAVNQAVSELNKLRKVIRDSSLPSSEWQKHRTALDEAAAQLAEVESRLATLLRERSRLQRLGGALPTIGRWKQLNEQLALMSDVTLLPADFAENRRKAISQLESARRAEQDAQAELVRLEPQIAGLIVPEALLAHAEEIEAIYKDLSVHRKAQADLPALTVQREHFEKEASALLAELHPELALAEAGQLRLSRRQQVEIQNLGSQQGTLEKQWAQSQAAIVDARQALAEIADQLAALPPARNTAPLAEAVRAAQGQGNLSEQEANLRAEIDSMTTQAAIDLKRLQLWNGPLEAIETLPLPSTETIARFELAIAEADAAIARIESQLEKSKADAAEAERHLEQLRLEGDVPTEAGLAEARAQRDALWQEIAACLSSTAESSREISVDELSGYEQAVRKADAFSDRLRREANRVAGRATLEAHLSSLQQQSAERERQLDMARQRRGEIETDWQTHWQPVNIVPLTPREMQSWLQRVQTLVQNVQAIRRRTAEFARVTSQTALHAANLRTLLSEGGEASLESLLVRAEKVLQDIGAAANDRRQLERESTRLGKTAAQAEAKLELAKADLAQWKERWAAAIAPLDLPVDAAPPVVNAVVAQVGELFAKIDGAAGFCERIESIGRDADRFGRFVEQLLTAVGSERGPAESFEQAVDRLAAEFRKAAADRKTLDLLNTQRKQHDERRRQAHDLAETMQAQLSLFCQEAGCSNIEELPAREAASAEMLRLRRERESCEGRLLELAAGAPLDEFVTEASAVSADSLPSDVERLGAEISALEKRKSELNEAKGAEKAILGSMDATAIAASAAEDAQDVLAQLQGDVDHYLRLRLASAVLREGIERYRKKNEGPVLGRASALFRRLTLGSFESLRIDFDDRGEQILAGARPDGRTLLPTAMSEGTCDQLYLALRLASLETWLERNEPLPLIVDDILVSFDNARAAATLEVLAELSSRTQVIFFAHHEHLVDIARRCLPRDVLFEHCLKAAAHSNPKR